MRPYLTHAWYSDREIYSGWPAKTSCLQIIANYFFTNKVSSDNTLNFFTDTGDLKTRLIKCSKVVSISAWSEWHPNYRMGFKWIDPSHGFKYLLTRPLDKWSNRSDNKMGGGNTKPIWNSTGRGLFCFPLVFTLAMVDIMAAILFCFPMVCWLWVKVFAY